MKGKVEPKWANVWVFFAATYAIAWLIWLVAILVQTGPPNLLLVVLGAFVPSSMGILFIYLTQDRRGRSDFWVRVIDLRRIGWRWLAAILLVYPALFAVASILCSLLGGTAPSLAAIGRNLLNPSLMIQLVLANLIISSLSEELGWRGYALDQLQKRHSALVASLILGLVHALWHLPLFFIPGITQGEMGLLSLDALIFLVGVPAGAVVMTWVYNNTKHSILSAIFLHFLFNLCLDLSAGLHGALPTGYFAIVVGLLIVLDLILVAGWGTKTLAGRQARVASGVVFLGQGTVSGGEG